MNIIDKIEKSLGLIPNWRAYPELRTQYNWLLELEEVLADSNEEVEELKSQVEDLEEEIEELEDEVIDLKDLLNTHGVVYE